MGKNALKITGLTKQYKDFTLDNISFEVPQGSIVGLIGENGAGKSTTLKAVLGLINTDGGSISLFDGGGISEENKDHIGVVFDGSSYPDTLTPKQLGNVLNTIYHTWDSKIYSRLLDEFSLPLSKKLKHFSRGMTMKFSIAAALSHNPRLLILDEATSGLDPVIRDDILDILLDFMQEEDHSVLVSSHITSDLEKIADYIVFLHNGKVIFSKPKDELLVNYGIIKCGAAQFSLFDRQDIVTCRKQDYEWQVLVSDRKKAEKKYPKALIQPATIDEIMLMYLKGEKP